MPVGLPVCLRAALETVSLDHAGKSPALRDAGDVYRLALFEQPRIELLTDFQGAKVGSADLPQMTEQLAAGLVEVSLFRACCAD